MFIEKFHRITIVGLGLIGGSVALALRRAGYRRVITACGGSRGIAAAKACGVIDEIETCFSENRPCESELVYLAAPISGITEFLRTRAHLIKRGTLVTDAGSTKREICAMAEQSVGEGVHFIGGHPIAGKEAGGFENADANLFDGAAYALTPSRISTPEILEAVSNLARSLGAEPVVVSPEVHDRTLSMTSHLPQILSSALAGLVLTNNELPGGLCLTGSGFRSMTRLAASPWSVWADIVESNRDYIAGGIGKLEDQLRKIREALERGSPEVREEALRRMFEEGNRAVSGSACDSGPSRED